MTDWDEETARWYAEHYGDWPTIDALVERAALRPTDRVLDIGCGTGSALRLAAAVVTEGTLHGVDPTPEMVRIAREQTAASPQADRLRLDEAPAEDLPLAAASVDVALAINSVTHWEDVDAGLREAFRVLAPGGRLLLAASVEAGGGSPLPERTIARLEALGFAGVTAEEFGLDGPAGPIQVTLMRAPKP